MTKRLILVLVLALLPGACTTFPPSPPAENPAPISLSFPDKPWQGQDLDIIQDLTSISPGGRHRFMARLALRQDSVKISLLAPTGQRGLDIHWQGGTQIETQRSDRLPPEINGRRILTELFLTYWPDAVVQSSLGGNLRVISTNSTRQVFDGPAMIMAIAGGDWDGKTVLDHKRDGYKLDIRSRRITGQ